jgi:GNAT superfamily N-acetyltransferase
MQRLVTTTYLEMTDRAAFRPKRAADESFLLTRAPVDPDINRSLYVAVGAQWHWYERLAWDDARWRSYIDRAGLQTWVATIAGERVGYFELEDDGGGSVEIVYFGLLPRFIGKGLGGDLLTAGVDRAWQMGAKRVWVHTCDLDHPHALANYKARGFQPYRAEQKMVDLPG